MKLAIKIFKGIWWLFSLLFMVVILDEYHKDFTRWGVIAWAIATLYICFGTATIEEDKG